MDFVFYGSKAELKTLVSKFVDGSDIERFIEGLDKYSSDICGLEYIKTELIYPELPPGSLSFLLPSKNYNINLKATTIVVLLLLLDIATVGISDRILEWTGIDIKTQGLYKVNEDEGEKCTIIEILRLEHHIADSSILPPQNLACVNNDLKCKYRYMDRCKIKPNDVENILSHLCEKNVLYKQGNRYRYNF